MSRGGSRLGAGRKKGTPNKATARREKEIAKAGDTPLEYMIKVMRDTRAKATRRDDMAKAAAPYVHPKLSNMQHTGRDGGAIEHDLRHDIAADEFTRALLGLAGRIHGESADDGEAGGA